MSVATDAVLGHPGPWTIEDIEALPETGNHARYEILAPGILTVSPAPGFAHQCASFNLTEILRAAARAADSYVGVVQDVNVELPGRRLTIPDIIVVDGHVAETFPVRCQPAAVRLVVEIVSPGSTVTDRTIKPELYASARIPFYWRLEIESVPTLFAHVLRDDRYDENLQLKGGTRSTLPAPFPVEFDPADLLRLR